MKKYYVNNSGFSNVKTFIEVEKNNIDAIETLNKLGLEKVTKKSMQETLAWIKKEQLWGTENHIRVVNFEEFMMSISPIY